MGLFVSTVSTTIVIPELGIQLVHPTTNRELSAQFTAEELKNASTLTNAITSGQLTWKKTSGGPTELAADYDDDFLEVDELSTGTGQLATKAVRQDIAQYGGLNPFIAKQASSTNGTYVLNVNSYSVIVISGTASGYKVQLPDATTLLEGRKFEVFNQSSQPITLVYNNGATVVPVPANSFVNVTLEDNTTTNGAWLVFRAFIGTAAGILNYNLISSTAFSTTTRQPSYALITGFQVTPVAGTYAVWFSASSYYTTTPKGHWWAIYKAGVIATDSIRRQDTAHSNQTMMDTTQTIVQVNGTQTVDVRVSCDNTGTLTVNDRSLILIRLGD